MEGNPEVERVFGKAASRQLLVLQWRLRSWAVCHLHDRAGTGRRWQPGFRMSLPDPKAMFSTSKTCSFLHCGMVPSGSLSGSEALKGKDLSTPRFASTQCLFPERVLCAQPWVENWEYREKSGSEVCKISQWNAILRNAIV